MLIHEAMNRRGIGQSWTGMRHRKGMNRRERPAVQTEHEH